MKTLIIACATVCICLFDAPYAVAQRPNVIFILADDLGWGDLQCYGNPYVETPALNKLAAEGTRFTSYYTPSPLCAPARAALLTGRFNHRTGAIDVSSNRGIDRIALSERTIADYFGHAGYATALIGKWHNGLYNNAYLPNNRGFDHFYGFLNGGQDYYQWNLTRNGIPQSHDGRYLTDALNEEAVRFVEQHREEPFFLFLSHHAPHAPFQAPDSLVEKYVARIGKRHPRQVAIIYAMIEVMDHGIGKLVDKLEELKIRENTIIVFTSDNGASYVSKELPRFQGPWSGEKGNVLEQGIRVPAIVSWKDRIPPGRVIDTPVHGCDWLPTLYSVTSYDAPEGANTLDGVNLMPLFTGEEVPFPDRKLFFQKNRYTPIGHSDGSMRMGKWKLYWPMVGSTMKKDIARDNPSYERGLILPHWEMPIDSDLPTYAEVPAHKPRLYNLAIDPSERYDVAAEHPKVLDEMVNAYDLWFDDVIVDWHKSWTEIREQDMAYWRKKKIPDPRNLFDKFWRWDGVQIDSATSDPLKVFTGYWTHPKPSTGMSEKIRKR